MNALLIGLNAFKRICASRPRAGVFLGLLAALLFSVVPAQAQSAYDNSTIHFDNNSGDPLFVTFASGNAYNITYLDNGNLTTVPVGNLSLGGYSSPIPLANVTSGNFQVYTANSVVALISYGTPITAPPAPSVSSSNDPNYLTRWATIEFTRSGIATDNGDPTGINGFAASLSIQNYNGTFGNLTPQGSNGSTGFAGMNVTTGNVIQSAYNTLKNINPNIVNTVPNLPLSVPATFVTSTNSTSGNFVRITAPNSFPGSDPTSPFGTYPSFGNYFTYIKNNNVAANITNLTFQYSNWRYAYSFNATINATGNYVLVGSITASDLHSSANVTETNLVITLPNDTGNILSYMTYQAQYPFPAGTDFSGNWSNITSAQPVGGGGNQTAFDAQVAQEVEQRILGDLAEGLNIGAIGSNVSFMLNGNLTPVGNMTSTDWFTFSPHDFYGNVSVGADFFNVYSAALYAASGNDSVFYYAPYDDRFQNGPSNPDIPMDSLWVVTLNPNGDLAFPGTVPEPATYALLFSGAAMLVAVGKRRRSQTACRKLPVLSSSPPPQPSARSAPAKHLRS